MSKLVVSFSVDSEKDADIVGWIEGQRNRSAAIRDAVRLAVERSENFGAVISGIREIKEMLESGAVIQNRKDESGAENVEDPRIAAIQAKLDKLGTW